MITTIHHVAIIVSSDKCLEFYRLLGFNEFFRKTRKRDTVVLMEGFGFQLEFFIDPTHQKSANEPLGIRHLALTVDGNLEDEIMRLTSLSSAVLDVGSIMKDWTQNRFCFVKDYDGIPVELRENKNISKSNEGKI